MFLQNVDRHLEGEAAQWVLKTPNVRALVYKGYMELATESDIETFIGALTQRFQLTDEEAKHKCEETPLYRLYRLEKGSRETLEEYYNRARLLLIELHGNDAENDALAPSQKVLCTIVV